MGKLLSPEEKYLRSITEATWQSKVIETAGYLGWNWWHDRDSRGNKSGLPDLLLWKHRQFLAPELKTETGRVKPEQLELLHQWHDAGIEVHIWRPRHERTMIRRLRLPPQGWITHDDCELCVPPGSLVIELPD